MGSFKSMGFISNLPISEDTDIVLFFLKNERNKNVIASCVYPNDDFSPYCLPIFGKYDGYGGINDIVTDDNVKFIEEKLGVSIEDLVSKTYKNMDRYSDSTDGLYYAIEMKEVYDFMVQNGKNNHYNCFFDDDYDGSVNEGKYHLMETFLKEKSERVMKYDDFLVLYYLKLGGDGKFEEEFSKLSEKEKSEFKSYKEEFMNHGKPIIYQGKNLEIGLEEHHSGHLNLSPFYEEFLYNPLIKKNVIEIMEFNSAMGNGLTYKLSSYSDDAVDLQFFKNYAEKLSEIVDKEMKKYDDWDEEE